MDLISFFIRYSQHIFIRYFVQVSGCSPDRSIVRRGCFCVEMETEGTISRETGQKFLESWTDRAFNQGVQVQILKTVAFLNDFDTKVRSRLSELDRKLIFMNKRIAYLESAVGDEDTD
jgi:hypothetical protein